MIFGDNIHVEENPQQARVGAVMQMMKCNEKFRYSSAVSSILPAVSEKYPEALENIWSGRLKIRINT